MTFYGWPAADLFLSAFQKRRFRPVSHLSFVKTYPSFTGYTRAHHEVAYVLAKGSPVETVGTNFGRSELAAIPATNSIRRKNRCPRLRSLVLSFLRLRLGSVVLDPFCGSGSSLIAARNVGRKGLESRLSQHMPKWRAGELGQS